MTERDGFRERLLAAMRIQGVAINAWNTACAVAEEAARLHEEETKALRDDQERLLTEGFRRAEEAKSLRERVAKLELILRFFVRADIPRGWLPGIGDVRNVTVTEDEWKLALEALK